jgi:hypothetical protein
VLIPAILLLTLQLLDAVLQDCSCRDDASIDPVSALILRHEAALQLLLCAALASVQGVCLADHACIHASVALLDSLVKCELMRVIATHLELVPRCFGNKVGLFLVRLLGPRYLLLRRASATFGGFLLGK